MKLQRKFRSDVISMGSDEKVVEASIDMASMDIILHNLSNMYSDPYGSIVRELTSNCFDAHKQAGLVDQPVFVGFMEDEDLEEFVFFKDQGVGMDWEFMRSVFMKYGSSTKRESNEMFGMFGLGSKSPLSIRKEFYIDSVKDGTLYNYVIYIGDKNRPELDILDEQETDQPNGTTVKIQLEHDKTSFLAAFRRQLIYFRDVVYEGIDHMEFNNYNIVEFDSFRFNTKINELFSAKNTADISYERVVYPIDYHALDLAPLSIPIGIKFSIGELEITPSRESIIYNDHEKSLIKERIKNTCIEIINRFNDKAKVNHDSYMEYQLNNKNYNLPDCHLEISAMLCEQYMEDNHLYDTDCPTVNRHTFIPFKEIGVDPRTDPKGIFPKILNLTNHIKGGRNFSFNGKPTDDLLRMIFSYDRFGFESGVRYRKKTYRVMPKVSLDPGKNRTIGEGYIVRPKMGYHFKIALRDYVRENVLHDRKHSNLWYAVHLYRWAMKEVIATTNKYDDIPVTEAKKTVSELYFNVLAYRKIADGKIQLNSDQVKKWFKNNKRTYVIGDKSEQDLLYLYSCIQRFGYNKSRGGSPIHFAITTKKNKEYLLNRGIRNLMSVTEFNNSKTFKNIVTSIYIQKHLTLLDEFRNEIPYIGEGYYRDAYMRFIELLNKDVYDKIIKVVKFFTDYRLDKSNSLFKEDKGVEFVETLIELSKNNKLLNLDIVQDVEDINKFCNNFSILPLLSKERVNDALNDITSPLFQSILKFFKDSHIRLNSQHYNMLYEKWEIHLINESYEKVNYLNTLNKLNIAS